MSEDQREATRGGLDDLGKAYLLLDSAALDLHHAGPEVQKDLAKLRLAQRYTSELMDILHEILNGKGVAL